MTKKKVTYHECPYCEAGIPSSRIIDGKIPKHTWMGKTCPGSGETLPKKNPSTEMRKWYCVHQSQKGAWVQIGYYADKVSANRLVKRSGGRCRVKLAFPGRNHPVIQGKIKNP